MKFTDVYRACTALQNDNQSNELEKLFELERIKNYQEHKEAILYFFDQNLLTPDTLYFLLQSKVPKQVCLAYQYLLEEGIKPDLEWLINSKHPYKKACFISLLFKTEMNIFLNHLHEIDFNTVTGAIEDYQTLLSLLRQEERSTIENIRKILAHPNPKLLTQTMLENFKDANFTVDVFNFLINANTTELKAYSLFYQAQVEWSFYQNFLKLAPQENEIHVLDRVKAVIILHQEGIATKTNLNLVQLYVLSAQKNDLHEENLHQTIAKTLVYLHHYPQLVPYQSYLFDAYPSEHLCGHLLDLIEEDFWIEQQELPELFHSWRMDRIRTLEPYKYSQKYIKECVYAHNLLMRNKDIIKRNSPDLFASKQPIALVEACIELGPNLTQSRITLLQKCTWPLYWAKILSLYLKNNIRVHSEFELSLSKNNDLDRVYDFLTILDRHQFLWLKKVVYQSNSDIAYRGCKILDEANLSIKAFLSKARDKLCPLDKIVLCLQKMLEKNYLTENLVNFLLGQSVYVPSFLLTLLEIVPPNIKFILSDEFIQILKETKPENYDALIEVLEWFTTMNSVSSEFFEYVIKNPHLDVVKIASKLPPDQLSKFCADLQNKKPDARERAGINYLTSKYCEHPVAVSHRIFKSFFAGINFLEKHYQLNSINIFLLSKIPKEHKTIAEFILLRPGLVAYQEELINLSLRDDLQTLLCSAQELDRFNVFNEEIFLKLLEENLDYPSLVNLIVYSAQYGYYSTFKNDVLAHPAPREFVNILYKLPNLPSALFKSLVSDEHYYQAVLELTTCYNFRGADQILDILYLLQGVDAPQIQVQILKTLGVENFIFWGKVCVSPAAIQFISLISQKGLTVDAQLVHFLLTATEPEREHITATFIAIDEQNIQLTDEQLRMIFCSPKPEFFLKVCHLPVIINNPPYYSFALNYLADDFVVNLQQPERTITALFGLTHMFSPDIKKADFFQPAMDILFAVNNQPPTIEEAILFTANENFAVINSLYSLLKRYCAPEHISPWLIADMLSKAQMNAYLLTAEAEKNFWQKVYMLHPEEFAAQFTELLNYSSDTYPSDTETCAQYPTNLGVSGYSGTFFARPESDEEPPTKKPKYYGSFGTK